MMVDHKNLDMKPTIGTHPFLVNALVGSCIRTLLYMISQLDLYPNGYGVLVLVGLMFATIICYICRFVTYN